jgi:hypothetical protein
MTQTFGALHEKFSKGVYMVEGQERRTPSGIENPNSLKLSYTTKVGRRNAGLTVTRNAQNTMSIANATFAPIESLSLSRDGKLSITLKDTFSDAEKAFIVKYMKDKFVARPASASKSNTTETTTTSDESTSSETPPPATSATASNAQIKVAIIKSKKLKATDENVSLVNDLMKEGGMTLDAAIGELASAT